MLSPWLNLTVKVQRRSGTARNVLNEPDWGTDANLPVAYDWIWCRIEYNDQMVAYTESGERVNVGGGTYMFVDDDVSMKAQDRITILTSDDPSLIGTLYIVTAVYREWNSVGNLHHYICQLQVH